MTDRARHRFKVLYFNAIKIHQDKFEIQRTGAASEVARLDYGESSQPDLPRQTLPRRAGRYHYIL